ncbi:MAG TPA: PrsW family glutamic-type intramembrane protease, partial [Anaerolineales bacterium]
MSPARAKKPKPTSLDWLTISQFGLGALGLSLAWMLALFSLIESMLHAVDAGEQLFSRLGDLVPIASLFVIGLLLLPSTFYALRRLLGRASLPAKVPGRLFGLAILLFPLLLAGGSWAVQAGLGWLALLAHLLAALLLVGWLLWLALRGLRPGSAQRSWGAFGSGMVASPILAFSLEAIGLIALILFLAIYIQVNPALSGVVTSLESATSANPEVLIQELAPLFNDPLVLLTAFLSLSLFVPVIEELLKPFAVYLLLRRELSEAQGFALGALSGAGYALAENLALNTQPENLFLVAAGRFGASAMHILTAALSGYALVRAKQQRRIWPFVGILALNIFIHGLWNGMVLLTTAAALTQTSGVGLVPEEA